MEAGAEIPESFIRRPVGTTPCHRVVLVGAGGLSRFLPGRHALPTGDFSDHQHNCGPIGGADHETMAAICVGGRSRARLVRRNRGVT